MATQLSTHFTLEELTHTDTGFLNVPNEFQRQRLGHLANYALERVRSSFGGPIKINSGFRSPAVNDAVSGSKTSAHLRGDAADIVPTGLDITLAYKIAMADLGLDYDQLIWEAHGVRGGLTRWIHVGLAAVDGTARRQQLIYSPKTFGKYLPFNEEYVL